MPHLICYDIVESKKRTKISNKLLEYGLERVQYSVFLGVVKPRKLVALKKKLLEIDDLFPNEVDSIIILELSRVKVKKMSIFGELDVDIDNLMGVNNTMYFQ